MTLTPDQPSDSAPVKRPSAGSHMPSELVGVAGFESAASSSRSQIAARATSAATRGLRQIVRACPLGPPLSVAIVTHFVTRSFASQS